MGKREQVWKKKATTTRFELARAEPIGFQVQLLNHSDTLSINGRNLEKTKTVWSSWVSIPVPLACKASTLPFELQPQLYTSAGNTGGDMALFGAFGVWCCVILEETEGQESLSHSDIVLLVDHIAPRMRVVVCVVVCIRSTHQFFHLFLIVVVQACFCDAFCE